MEEPISCRLCARGIHVHVSLPPCLSPSPPLSLSLSCYIDTDDILPSPIADDVLSPSAHTGRTSINHYTHTSAQGTVVASHHASTHTPAYPTITEEGEEESSGDVANSLTVTLPLPEQSRGRGIQPSQRREDDPRVLVFHGIILRSQLVTLLENKIFFSEEEGVRQVHVHECTIM